MSSAPNGDASNVPEPGLSRRPSPVLSIAGHAQKIFGHVKIENLVAGLSGGVVSTLVLHPLDLVKIRFAGTVLHLKSDHCDNFRSTESSLYFKESILNP